MLMKSSNPLKISVWASTLGADLLTLCRFLDKREDIRLTTFVENPERFKMEAGWRLDPLMSPVFQKGFSAYLHAFRHYGDITIVDNGVPFFKTSPKLFVLWHGFGWKGPDDRNTFAFMQSRILRWWGDPSRPNPDFRWQCFGEWDRRFRSEVSDFHSKNLVVLGSAFHDEIIKPLDKKKVADFYPFDLMNRKTVLLAPTWHYRGVFGQWGEEWDLFKKFIDFLIKKKANLILRMHDRWRYDKSYVRQIDRLSRENPHVMIKFKDQYQDNTVDLRLADVLITNFSSVANLFYATGRPTVHLYPVANPDAPYRMPRMWGGVLTEKKLPTARSMWKLPLEENGGLVANSETELLSHVEKALNDPDCCKEMSRAFLKKYMLEPDGKNCKRILLELQQFAQTS